MKGYLERAMGIEPTALAWEARVLPLYDARVTPHSMRGDQAVASVGDAQCAYRAATQANASMDHL